MAIKLENYDKGIEELIKIVNTLEKEQLSLEKSIELYKKGMKLHKELVEILEKEEGRLFLFDEKAEDEEKKFVEKTLEDGQVSLEL
ncbi:exodeoxyribonuclease VII, small subunit [Parvimonas sp. KA00067]|uniref:Exodeoxyribonuclease 7 small subunit n=1 Tax=Parvimonas parva TaxID=2769485 RepID=A0ABS1C8N7_9FIRM|nr:MULTISPECIES: exodeoxyribonuclease VII small subunit [Parvimonas]KXB66692.1 exodeoxyribonuclease VII, small subunit [Parvimonas sp. KA00067]MBK1468318.1 exodeoxyribonuclease VII small subunit [Parvimonas parva]